MLLTDKTTRRCSLRLILLHLMMATTAAAGGRGLLFSAGRVASPNLLLQPLTQEPTIEATHISDSSIQLLSNELRSSAMIHQERLQQQHQHHHRQHLLMGLLSGHSMKLSAAVQIGSHPPSCQNKCNMCNPCDAVQMPTPQGHQSLSHFLPRGAQFDTQQTNYNPESWKCKCGDSFFNP